MLFFCIFWYVTNKLSEREEEKEKEKGKGKEEGKSNDLTKIVKQYMNKNSVTVMPLSAEAHTIYNT